MSIWAALSPRVPPALWKARPLSPEQGGDGTRQGQPGQGAVRGASCHRQPSWGRAGGGAPGAGSSPVLNGPASRFGERPLKAREAPASCPGAVRASF